MVSFYSITNPTVAQEIAECLKAKGFEIGDASGERVTLPDSYLGILRLVKPAKESTPGYSLRFPSEMPEVLKASIQQSLRITGPNNNPIVGDDIVKLVEGKDVNKYEFLGVLYLKIPEKYKSKSISDKKWFLEIHGEKNKVELEEVIGELAKRYGVKSAIKVNQGLKYWPSLSPAWY